MKTTMRTPSRTLALTGVLTASMFGATTFAQTPEPLGCAAIGTPVSTSAAAMPGMDHGTPMTGMDQGMGTSVMMHEVEFDLMYIDMMIPHHESVIALAEVAQHELTHPRLIAIAKAIVETQATEIASLLELRGEWYGDAETVSMDMMMQGMPGMVTDMMAMEQQMNAEWQVQTFCAAEDKDLAFIEQVIPHHQMAIDASEAALERAVHPELVDIAEDVIIAQQAEIDELETIRAELTAGATPPST